MTAKFTDAEDAWAAEGEFTCCSELFDSGGVLVTATGELDMRTCGEFRDVLSKSQGSESDQLIVDLSGVTFMDSTALSCLVVLQRGMKRPLDVVVAQPHLRKLLFITGLNTVFTLHKSLDEARGRAASPRAEN